jgi:hypothetical protein
MAPRKRKLWGPQVTRSGPAWTYRSLQTHLKNQWISSLCKVDVLFLLYCKNGKTPLAGRKKKVGEGRGRVWSSQPQVFFLSPSQKPIEGPRKAKGISKQKWKDIQFRESWQVTHKGTQKTISLQNKGCVTLWPCHLHFKGILRQKKNYENSKYFTMQKYNLPKIL